MNLHLSPHWTYKTKFTKSFSINKSLLVDTILISYDINNNEGGHYVTV